MATNNEIATHDQQAAAIFKCMREMIGVPTGDGVSILVHIERVIGERDAALAENARLSARIAEVAEDRTALHYDGMRLAEEVERLTKEVEGLRKERDKLQAFKTFVHERLDRGGCPANPNPAKTDSTGCRIGGRLNWMFDSLRVKDEALRVGLNTIERLAIDEKDENEFFGGAFVRMTAALSTTPDAGEGTRLAELLSLYRSDYMSSEDAAELLGLLAKERAARPA